MAHSSRDSATLLKPFPANESVGAGIDAGINAATERVTTPERSALQVTFRALRHPNFRLFTVGQIISLIGTWMQNVAISWLVYRLRHSEFLLGVSWFCTQIPVFALAPIAGLASDRFSRHRIVVVTQILSMLQAFLLAILTLTGHIKVWQLFTLAVLLGVINAFDIPARQSFVVELTSKDDLLSAISLNSTIFNAARIAGPGVAGLVVARFGEGICFLVNGFSFVAVIGCLLAMRIPARRKAAHESPWIHLKKGFHFAYVNRPVRMLLLMMGLMTTAGMPALVLMPFFAGDIFHRGSQGLGFLMCAMGAGAVVGTLFLAGRSKVADLNRVIFFSALSLGFTYVVFARSTSFVLSLAVMPFIGFSVMRQMVSANTLIQTAIPDHFRGRIMALYTMMVVGLGPFGSLAAGGLAKAFGARVAVTVGGVLAFAAALILGLRLLKVNWEHV
ncbi:MAG: MFS transporter [Acidobacteriota bacterium]|nr:MFS transporter [Acidobacteriota bacterium]